MRQVPDPGGLMLLRAFIVALPLLFAGGLDTLAAAQDWAARFPRHPDCDAKRIRASGSSTGATGTLVVRPVIFGTDSAIEYGSVTLLPGTEPEPVRAKPGVALAPVLVFAGLAPGSYRVAAFALGYGKRSDTLTIDAGFTDTLWLPMPLIGEAVRNRYNCLPRGFRRVGEPVCVTDDSTTGWQVEHARRLAAPSERELFKLPPGDSSNVELIRDEAICARAAKLYGEKGDPPRRVIVIRMDNLYLVFDPFEPLEAGEWSIHKIFDLRWRVVARLAG